MKKHLSAVAAAALALAAAPAFAVDCTDGTLTGTFAGGGTTSYLACLGPYEGHAPDTVQFDGVDYTRTSKSDDPGNGVFDTVPQSNSGTITFDDPMTGLFALAIKAANWSSVYQFNGGLSGITSIAFDTLGIAVNRNDIPQDLSYAAYYGGVPPIPEPETYALMLAGLGVLVTMTRRRRQQP